MIRGVAVVDAERHHGKAATRPRPATLGQVAPATRRIASALDDGQLRGEIGDPVSASEPFQMVGPPFDPAKVCGPHPAKPPLLLYHDWGTIEKVTFGEVER